MKKFLTVLLAISLTLALAACSGDNNSTPTGGNTADTGSNQVNNQAENEQPEALDNSAATETKVLVAYFSATGTTKNLAEYAADALGADLYEIVPAEPYTAADLNYGDDNSRTSAEMNDSDARPEISGSVENMADYDIIFLGYPIWWGQAPRIISTFMESYDFAGKTIVPFCTSGSSPIGSSAANLHSLCSDEAAWLAGDRLSGSLSRDDMVEWLNGLGLEITAE